MRVRIDWLAAVALVWAPPLHAQVSWQRGDQSWCDSTGSQSSERFCEVRTATVPSTGSLNVDGRGNGGVRIEAWDRSEVEIVARVSADAQSDERAEELGRSVEIAADGGRIRAEGLSSERREHWSVSYRLRVPRDTDLDVRTTNGGIQIAEVSGDIGFRAVNGGVTLRDLAGDVRGRTTNGGLDVELAGDAWSGNGMDVETTNGGVSMSIPAEYSADLVVGTTNGQIETDFPLTIQGRIGRQPLRATLGDGGPTLRAVTTNGGVHITRN